MARDSAVVIGGGIAGLATARVLADRFGTVTLLDRDATAATAATVRPNVPQSGHPHVLLMAGLNGLEKLFPGVREQLVAEGAVEIDPLLDMRVYRGRLFPQRPSGMTLVCFSRPLLEQTLHRRLSEVPNVQVLGGVSVTGLIGSPARVTGVQLADGDEITADLVVDATGRSGRSDRWLEELGLAVPETSVVKVDVGYTSAYFDRRPEHLPGAKLAFTVPLAPAEKRFGVAVPVEGDRWLIALGGWHGEHAPTDPEGFSAFAHTLPHSDVTTIVDRADRLTDLTVCQFPASRRRHFEKLRRPPAGYVAVGDSLCTFNPVYGQGMSSAVGQAIALGRVLDEEKGISSTVARRFYRTAAKKVIVTPWQFAAGGDFNYPETEGRKPAGMDLFNGYVTRINDAVVADHSVQVTMAKVQHLLLPPTVIFRPSMLLKVFKATRRT